jgi:hypothetical protein
MSESNGKPTRKPRTKSHAPPSKASQDATTPRETGGSAREADDASAGLTAAPEPVVSPVSNNGHAPDGKFAAGNGIGHRFEKGNKFGRGNPLARRQHEHRMQFLDAVHPETIPALARKLQHDALKGDEFAVRVLLDYCLAKPAQAVELSGPDGTELGINFGAITTVVLGALSGPEHAEARVKIAADLMKLERDDDA